jgi:hypothetical protein
METQFKKTNVIEGDPSSTVSGLNTIHKHLPGRENSSIHQILKKSNEYSDDIALNDGDDVLQINGVTDGKATIIERTSETAANDFVEAAASIGDDIISVRKSRTDNDHDGSEMDPYK